MLFPPSLCSGPGNLVLQSFSASKLCFPTNIFLNPAVICNLLLSCWDPGTDMRKPLIFLTWSECSEVLKRSYQKGKNVRKWCSISASAVNEVTPLMGKLLEQWMRLINWFFFPPLGHHPGPEPLSQSLTSSLQLFLYCVCAVSSLPPMVPTTTPRGSCFSTSLFGNNWRMPPHPKSETWVTWL